MWALARTEIGLGTEEFWDLTPQEWNAIGSLYRQSHERLDVQFASIRKMLYDIHAREGSPHYTLDHFRLMKGEEEDEEDIAKAIEEQMRGLAEI